MKVIIIGGTRSGKSFLAEEISKLLNKQEEIIYIATMRPYSKEDIERIDAHINRRINENFNTIEIFSNILKIKKDLNRKETVLLDSITTLLNNEMFDEKFNLINVCERLSNEILNISKECENIIVVSDYLFNDSVIYEKMISSYIKQLAYINKKLVENFDVVIECINNNYIIHKGKDEGRALLNEIY